MTYGHVFEYIFVSAHWTAYLKNMHISNRRLYIWFIFEHILLLDTFEQMMRIIFLEENKFAEKSSSLM